MTTSSYIYAFFIFVLLGLFLLLLRQVLRSLNGTGGKQFERENKLFLLYQNVEDMMESLESYTQEVRDEIAREKADIAAMLIQARQLPAMKGELNDQQTADRRAREAELDQLLSARVSIDRTERSQTEASLPPPSLAAQNLYNARNNTSRKPRERKSISELPQLDRTPAMERIANRERNAQTPATPAVPIAPIVPAALAASTASAAPTASAAQAAPVTPETSASPVTASPEEITTKPANVPPHIASLFDNPRAIINPTATIPAAIIPTSKPAQITGMNETVDDIEEAELANIIENIEPENDEAPVDAAKVMPEDQPKKPTRSQRVQELNRQGMTNLEISRELGISVGEIALILGIQNTRN